MMDCDRHILNVATKIILLASMSVATTSSSSLACALLAVFIESIVIVEWLLMSAIALLFSIKPFVLRKLPLDVTICNQGSE